MDGREHRWQAGNSAMFLPGSALTGESGVRSVVAITLDPRRLEATARSMVAPRRGEERNLRMLGLDDTIHRAVALLLAPKQLAWSGGSSCSSASADAVRRVADYIVAHLDEPISLGDLERVGGIAARTMQASFKKSFNCSPREWIRQRRLLLARERLLSSTHLATVAAVAASCGFTRLGAFAAAYARRFGESPSETLQKRGRGF